jgi:hypothetical protein
LYFSPVVGVYIQVDINLSHPLSAPICYPLSAYVDVVNNRIHVPFIYNIYFLIYYR